jgi:hypothetical protein
MTAQTTWAYPVLAQNGIRYSSSVLPGAHPLSGWPHFGERPKVMDGILEIPLSVVRFFGMRLPFASGLYLRVLPFALVKRRFLTLVKHGGPIVSYVHLLDFDQELKRLSLPIINQIPFVNFLMYYNRAGAFARLRTLLEVQNIRVLTYQEFFTRHATAFRVCSNHKIASFSDSIGSSLKPDFLTEHRVAGENPSSPVIAMNSHTVQLKD